MTIFIFDNNSRNDTAILNLNSANVISTRTNMGSAMTIPIASDSSGLLRTASRIFIRMLFFIFSLHHQSIPNPIVQGIQTDDNGRDNRDNQYCNGVQLLLSFRIPHNVTVPFVPAIRIEGCIFQVFHHPVIVRPALPIRLTMVCASGESIWALGIADNHSFFLTAFASRLLSRTVQRVQDDPFRHQPFFREP